MNRREDMAKVNKARPSLIEEAMKLLETQAEEMRDKIRGLQEHLGLEWGSKREPVVDLGDSEVLVDAHHQTLIGRRIQGIVALASFVKEMNDELGKVITELEEL